MGGRLDRLSPHEAVDDPLAGDPPDQQGEESETEEAPTRRAQRLPSPPTREPDCQREEAERQGCEGDRYPAYRLGDVLRGLELVRAHDHETAARRRQRHAQPLLCDASNLLPGSG